MSALKNVSASFVQRVIKPSPVPLVPAIALLAALLSACGDKGGAPAGGGGGMPPAEVGVVTVEPHAVGLVTELPGALSRRLDPRAGASLVWGMVRAGAAKNVIPSSGEVAGTLRMLDAVAWADAEDLVRELIDQIIAPYGVHAEVGYVRGVPPVVNETVSTALLAEATSAILGPEGLVSTPQSLGGEDFAWYVETVPGAMGRLGTRTPGGTTYDLHQGDLVIDERSIAVGARVLAAVALEALTG